MRARASTAPPPQQAATARRKSFGTSGLPRTGVNEELDPHSMAQLQSALAHHDPASYASPSSSSSSRAALGLGARRTPSRSATPASPVRSRPKTPAFAQNASNDREAPPLPMGHSSHALQVGDQVKAVGHEGVLQFLGTIEGKNGVFAGIELMGASRGKGKNDGSVDGKAYFRCEPLCGLFVPEAKVQLVFQRPPSPFSALAALPKASPHTPSRAANVPKSSREAAKAAEAKISQGSRASKYLNVTAAELATRQESHKVISPTKRPASPEKAPGTPLSASATTPRPRPRVSGALPTPRSVSYSARRSIGGTPSSKSPHKRPASVLDNNAPAVPPIPASYASGRSTPARRASEISSHGGLMNPFGSPSSVQSSRPMTPARAASRASLASRGQPPRPSSVLSNSAASSVADDDRDWEGLQADRQSAIRRAEEARAAQLETEKSLKTSELRFEELRKRLEDSSSRIKELEVLAEKSRIAGAETKRLKEATDGRLQDLEVKLAASEKTRQELIAAQTASHSQEADIEEAVRLKVATATSAFVQERANLNAELDRLREAGQALCSVYEERLASAAENRRQLEDALRSTEAELLEARAMTGVLSQHGDSSSPSALAIDNETLKAEVEHLRGRLGTLEDSLEEARHNLDNELQSSRQKRHESGDQATAMKNEVKLLKERLEHSAQREARSSSRIVELEQAIKESKASLEIERGELEHLRAEASTTASAETVGKQLDNLRRERDAARAEAKAAQARLADAEEELRLTEELKQADVSPLSGRTGMNKDQLTPTRPKNLTSPDVHHDHATLRAQHERELQARDAEVPKLRTQIMSLQTEGPTGSISASSGSLASPIGRKDETAIARDQLAGLKVLVSQLNEEVSQLQTANKQLKRDLRDAHDSQSNGHAINGSDETAELRKQLEEAEKRSAREIKALNQEVADLESLVEAKIFKEDEVTDELNRFKRLLEKAKAQGFSVPAADERSTKTSAGLAGNASIEACAICNDIGQCVVLLDLAAKDIIILSDLSTCPALSNGTYSAGYAIRADEAFCEDCAEYGHSVDACPNALETF